MPGIPLDSSRFQPVDLKFPVTEMTMLMTYESLLTVTFILKHYGHYYIF